jgi:GTP-binding protein HflX
MREAHPEAAFVSALRGIGVRDLKARLVEIIDHDYAEAVIYLPVEDQRVIARIRQLGEVLSEDYLNARVERDADPRTLVRLRFRTSERHRKDVEPIVNRYRQFSPVSDGLPPE